jgi:outer membrane lipoprotein-sorting protein
MNKCGSLIVGHAMRYRRHIASTVHFSIIGVILFCSVAATAGPPKIATLKTDFVMTRKVAVLRETLTSSGCLMLAGEGRLRFETRSPSKSTLIINADKGWLHYPDLNVTKGFDIATDPVMKLMSEQLFALTGGDIAQLGTLYDIRKNGDNEQILIPKTAGIGKLFKELRVTLQTRGIVSEVVLIAQNGDTTTIAFHNTALNAPLDASLFAAPTTKKGQ